MSLGVPLMESFRYSIHFTKEIPECPFPFLTKNGQLKKDAELFEKKVRVRVEEVGRGGGQS